MINLISKSKSNHSVFRVGRSLLPSAKSGKVNPRLAPLWVPPRNLLIVPAGHYSTPAAAFQTPALTQSQNANGAAVDDEFATLDVSITWPGATTTGRLLIAIVAAYRATTDPVLTPPSGWTLAKSDVVTVVVNHYRTAIYYKANASSESGAKTWSTDTSSLNGAGLGVVVAEYSGVATSTPLDVTASATDSSAAATTCNSGTTGSTAQANELVIAALQGGSALGSPSNSFTIQNQTTADVFVALLHKILTSIDTPSTSATYVTTRGNVGCIATFKAAAV